MATIQMTAGDYVQFQLTVTRGGGTVDLTGAQSLDFVVQDAGGVELARWALGSGVVITDPTHGVAVLTVTPAMTAFATTFVTGRYTWSLVDASGNPTQAIEQGVFQITLPP
jgi:hypothetical protein